MSGSLPRPIALVYRDKEQGAGCAESLAELLRKSKWGFDVRFVGPDEKLKLTADTLESAALYAQPGGNGTLADTWGRLSASSDIIHNYTYSGGRYLGICMGGYLAGATPGYHLLPGDSDQYIASPGATVTSDADTVVEVYWRGKPRYMYFQDGPYFVTKRHAIGVTVLATYTNGEPAALVAPCGKGKVAVSGPHPEADQHWYSHYHLIDPDGPDADLGQDLIDTLME
jgi:glutamine amidotransferase-like uncharacterized protein